jgi:hypothetical protein
LGREKTIRIIANTFLGKGRAELPMVVAVSPQWPLFGDPGFAPCCVVSAAAVWD